MMRMTMRLCLAVLGLAMVPSEISAREREELRTSEREQAAAAVFDRVKANRARLRVFLQAMPKGGDLHNHLSGTPYAEDYLAWAAQEGMCANLEGTAIALPPCEPGRELAALGTRDPALYSQLIDELSTRGWQKGVGADERTGHAQFFSTFDRFAPIAELAVAESIVSARNNAASSNVHYLELMHFPRALAAAVRNVTPADLEVMDFAREFAALQPDLPELLDQAVEEIDATEAAVANRHSCNSPMPDPGCSVSTLYSTIALREFPPNQVFRMVALGFALADRDPRFVGVNIVQPEDGPRALQDYDLHMEMYRYFAERYPQVPITVHAGELALGQVPILDMRDHIAKAIGIAGADRIGHGTAIAYETDAVATLERMAEEGIAVEINLSSNDVILGVTGTEHPLQLYLAAGVPLVLSTDDEGVLRIDMTNEYLRAASEHSLTYRQLKQISRNGLEYSFIPGESLWRDRQPGIPVAPCSHAVAGAEIPAAACAELLATSAKAREQMRLEQAFLVFERDVAAWQF